jgi:hypothetical protein
LTSRSSGTAFICKRFGIKIIGDGICTIRRCYGQIMHSSAVYVLAGKSAARESRLALTCCRDPRQRVITNHVASGSKPAGSPGRTIQGDIQTPSRTQLREASPVRGSWVHYVANCCMYVPTAWKIIHSFRLLILAMLAIFVYVCMQVPVC